MTDLDGRHRVQALVTRPAVYVHGTDTLHAVSEVLAANEIGAVLVRAPEIGAEGIVSERDVVRTVADGGDLELVRADEVMSEDLVYVERGTEISEAAKTMHSAGVRHLVVMEDGRPFGVISERDLLHAFINGDT